MEAYERLMGHCTLILVCAALVSCQVLPGPSPENTTPETCVELCAEACVDACARWKSLGCEEAEPVCGYEDAIGQCGEMMSCPAWCEHQITNAPEGARVDPACIATHDVGNDFGIAPCDVLNETCRR